MIDETNKLAEEFRAKVLMLASQTLPGLTETDPKAMSIFIDEMAFMIGLAAATVPKDQDEGLSEAIMNAINEGRETIRKTYSSMKAMEDVPMPSGSVH